MADNYLVPLNCVVLYMACPWFALLSVRNPIKIEAKTYASRCCHILHHNTCWHMLACWHVLAYTSAWHHMQGSVSICECMPADA